MYSMHAHNLFESPVHHSRASMAGITFTKCINLQRVHHRHMRLSHRIDAMLMELVAVIFMIVLKAATMSELKMKQVLTMRILHGTGVWQQYLYL